MERKSKKNGGTSIGKDEKMVNLKKGELKEQDTQD